MERFIKHSVLGNVSIIDNRLGNTIKRVRGSWYVEHNKMIVGSISDVYTEEVVSSMLFGNKNSESFEMLGYFGGYDPFTLTCSIPNIDSTISIVGEKYLVSSKIADSGKTYKFSSANIDQIVAHILRVQEKHISTDFDYRTKVEGSHSVEQLLTIEAKNKINKGKGRQDTWDYTRNMVRVKSSNVWSYSFRLPKDSDFGDLFVQFKNKTGGPGDIYQYFNVPANLWKKFIRTNSKGHFFWKNIRNAYKYRKLSGDRRGKLPNAIN